MTIPADWQILTPAIAELLSQSPKARQSRHAAFFAKLFAHIKEHQKDFFICDIGQDQMDFIEIVPTEMTKKSVLARKPELHKIQMARFFKKTQNVNVVFSEIKHRTIAGLTCYFMDFSLAPGMRNLSYDIVIGERVVCISLQTSLAAYQQRKQDLETALATIKIHK